MDNTRSQKSSANENRYSYFAFHCSSLYYPHTLALDSLQPTIFGHYSAHCTDDDEKRSWIVRSHDPTWFTMTQEYHIFSWNERLGNPSCQFFSCMTVIVHHSFCNHIKSNVINMQDEFNNKVSTIFSCLYHHNITAMIMMTLSSWNSSW